MGTYDPLAHEGMGKSANAGLQQRDLQSVAQFSLFLSSYSLSLLTSLSLSTAWIGIGRGELSNDVFSCESPGLYDQCSLVHFWPQLSEVVIRLPFSLVQMTVLVNSHSLLIPREDSFGFSWHPDGKIGKNT